METACRGTNYGINHGHLEQPWQRYEMYRKMFGNCTYVDGNLEILFLDGDHHYDMSFLQVSLPSALHCQTPFTRYDRL